MPIPAKHCANQAELVLTLCPSNSSLPIATISAMTVAMVRFPSFDADSPHTRGELPSPTVETYKNYSPSRSGCGRPIQHLDVLIVQDANRLGDSFRPSASGAVRRVNPRKLAPAQAGCR